MAPVENTEHDPAQQGVSLTFHEISYAVSAGDSKNSSVKMILKGASGRCLPGRVMAIMGPSGAGKTSLLDVLAGRKVPSCGQLCLGGVQNVGAEVICKHSVYVQQDDCIMASQTVREAINMAALLTLPKSMAMELKKTRVEEMLKTFQLEDCADTIIGDPVKSMKGVSGGERKRTAIAMMACLEPRLMFLDEPTSGLDAFKAYDVVRVLKSMAIEHGSAIVCTVHQPSSKLFALFDDLMLLLDGHVIYNGPALDSLEHFSSLGFQCPQFDNPADFIFMDVLPTQDKVDRQRALVDGWKCSPRARVQQELLEQIFNSQMELPKETSERCLVDVSEEHRPSLGLQFKVLFQRAANDLKRNPMRARAPFAQAIMLGIISAMIFWQMENDQNGVQDRMGCLFLLVLTSLLGSIMPVLTTFSNERSAFLRERENGMYLMFPYFMSRILVDIVVRALAPAILVTIAYWTTGLQEDGIKYVQFLGLIVMCNFTGNAIGLFFATLFSDISVALVLMPLMILPLMMFSGLFLNPESTPVYLKWLELISPPKFLFSALAQIEFSGLELHCTEEQLRPIPLATGGVAKICPITSGDQHLKNLNIQKFLSVGVCALVLAMEAVVFTIAAFFGLWALSNRSMRKSRGKGVKVAQEPGLVITPTPVDAWNGNDTDV